MKTLTLPAQASASPSTFSEILNKIKSRLFEIILYSIVNLGAFFIGADCAINAAYYLSKISWLSSSVWLIILAALSGFLLNFLLYALDAPSVLKALPQSLQDDFNDLSWQKIVCNIIALGSGVMMGLFTYQTYIAFQLKIGAAHLLFSPALVITMCLAYAILTFTLIRSSLNSAFQLTGASEVTRLDIKSSGYTLQQATTDLQKIQDTPDLAETLFNDQTIITTLLKKNDAIETRYTAFFAMHSTPSYVVKAFLKMNKALRSDALFNSISSNLIGYSYEPTTIEKIKNSIWAGKSWNQATNTFDDAAANGKSNNQGSKAIRAGIFFLIFSSGAIATIATAWTWMNAAYQALLSFHLASLTALIASIVLSLSILAGELVFTLNVSTWLSMKINSKLNITAKNNVVQNKAAKSYRLSFIFIFGLFVVANALGNAGIACNGSATLWGIIVAILGGVLSLTIMTRTMGESSNGSFSFAGLWDKIKATLTPEHVSFMAPMIVSISVVAMLTISQLQAWHIIELAPANLSQILLILGIGIAVIVVLELVHSFWGQTDSQSPASSSVVVQSEIREEVPAAIFNPQRGEVATVTDKGVKTANDTNAGSPQDSVATVAGGGAC